MSIIEIYKIEAKQNGFTLIEKSDKSGHYNYIFDKCGHKKELVPNKVRNSNPICNICRLEEIKQIGKDKGLIFIGNSEQSGHYLFEFDTCGHQRVYKPANIKRRKPTCDVCQLEKIKQGAIEKGLTLIGASGKFSHYFYKFDKCGHQKEYSPGNLKKRNPTCDICQFEVYNKESKLKGLTIIKKLDRTAYYLYKFDKCGHEKQYVPANLRKENPICEICRIEQFKIEAKKKGLSLIGESDISSYYLYEFDKCGHRKDDSPSHIRERNQLCEFCDECHFDNESYVYLFNITNNKKTFLKLGISSNIKERIKSYKLKDDYSVNVLDLFLFDNRYISTKFEKSIHKKNITERLSPNEMRKIMKSGFTECYPISMQDSLLSEINNLRN